MIRLIRFPMEREGASAGMSYVAWDGKRKRIMAMGWALNE
ncbi:hypothetical protein HmCmsJML182_03204 [Escherichia coli]|nr:hypothetical protein HmCmsJML182_03204 [Escherichia coli]